MKDKSPKKCCLQSSELSDKATKQFTNRLLVCERNRRIAAAVSPDSQSRISAKQSNPCAARSNSTAVSVRQRTQPRFPGFPTVNEILAVDRMK